MSVQVLYQDAKGAGCMRRFTNEDELARFCERLRRPAQIMLDGKQIGEVYRGTFDDPRRKWGWFFERFLEYEDAVRLRCDWTKGGGGRVCMLPEKHKGPHSFQCGI